MRIFTHTYKIEIISNGKLCWRNHGWIEKGINDYRKDKVFDFTIILGLFAMLVFG